MKELYLIAIIVSLLVIITGFVLNMLESLKMRKVSIRYVFEAIIIFLVGFILSFIYMWWVINYFIKYC